MVLVPVPAAGQGLFLSPQNRWLEARCWKPPGHYLCTPEPGRPDFYSPMPGLKARCWKPPGHYLCTPEPGRPDCVISIEIGVNGDANHAAVSQKVTKNLPVSFYSPMPGFKARCWKPPGHYLCIPEPGRPDCVISIEIGVNGDAYPAAISPKVTKNLPVSFYSPTSGLNSDKLNSIQIDLLLNKLYMLGQSI